MRKCFSYSDPVQLEMIVIEKTADLTPSTSRKHERMFVRDKFEREDIIVVSEGPPRRSLKEQVLVPRTTATELTNTSEAGNKEKDDRDDHSKRE